MLPALPEQEALAWIGLGGNLGDVRTTLAAARLALGRHSARSLLASRLFGSAPWGESTTPGPDYVNQVVGLWTRASPEDLLALLLSIETSLGRVRGARWGPRTLDLDLLALGSETRRTPALTLPHPRLSLRRFVLLPWADLAPACRPPGFDSTVGELLAACPDPGAVWPLSD